MSLQLADIAPDFTSETTAAKDWRHFIGSMSLVGDDSGGLVRTSRALLPPIVVLLPCTLTVSTTAMGLGWTRFGPQPRREYGPQESGV